MDFLMDFLSLAFFLLLIFYMLCGIWFISGVICDYMQKPDRSKICTDGLSLLKKIFVILKKGLKTFCKFFYSEITGHAWPGEEINASIPLTIEELTLLVKYFDKKLYLVPALSGYCINPNGFFQIRIRSIAFKRDYDALSPEQHKKLVSHIIQSFYLECRGFITDVYILAISPTFLDIALPMSQKGKDYLERLKQQARETPPKEQQEYLPDLSEEIPVLNKEDEDDDPRL